MTIAIGWKHFDKFPENTIFCRCGAVFRSHSKAVMAEGGMNLVSRKPCPSCGSSSNVWKAASDPETHSIGIGDRGSVTGVATTELPRNRSLYTRTQPAFYDNFRKSARGAGASEEAVERMVAADISVAQSLLDGKCPKCLAPISRYIDHGRQQGPSDMPGTWVQYRCSTDPPPGVPGTRKCGFMIDLVEGEASN